jgi:hypothetical protein
MTIERVLRFVIAGLCLVACHRAAPRPTLTGAALYAQVDQFAANGRVKVPTVDGGTVVVSSEQYLVTAGRAQTYVVGQLLEGCSGGGPEADTNCALALMLDTRFSLRDAEEIRLPREQVEEPEMSGRSKAALVLLGAGAALTAGAVTADCDGCKELFGIGAGLDALLLILVLWGAG